MATGYEEAIQGEVVDEGTSEIPFSSDALAVLNKSEIEQQVEISKKYPRNIEKFRQTLDKYACLNPAIATSMFYSLPRAGKQIVGAVKEGVGRLVGDAKLQVDGKAAQVEGKLQNAAGSVKDTLRR